YSRHERSRWSRFRLRETVSSRVSVRPEWPVGGREAPVGGRGRLVARPSRATWPLRPHRHARASQESKTDMTAMRKVHRDTQYDARKTAVTSISPHTRCKAMRRLKLNRLPNRRLTFCWP